MSARHEASTDVGAGDAAMITALVRLRGALQAACGARGVRARESGTCAAGARAGAPRLSAPFFLRGMRGAAHHT